jgi:hypothetical protein
VTLNVNGVGAKPILKQGGDSLAAADLKAGQIVSVVYDSASGGAFKLVGSYASDLDDLTDVTISSPSAGQVVRYNGSQFVNANLAAGDLPSAMDAAKIGGGSVSNTEFGYLDGVTSAIQTQIDAKAASSHNHAASDINSGQVDLARGGTARDNSGTNVGMGTNVFAGGLSGGADNTAFGYNCAAAMTGGDKNSFYGSGAGSAITTGLHNGALGYAALSANQTGNNNNAFGASALASCTGSSHTAIGHLAGYAVSSGTGTTALGNEALGDNTSAKSGDYTTSVGYRSGFLLSSGGANSFYGAFAGHSVSTGGSCCAFGYQALGSNGVHAAHYTIAIGRQSLYSLTSGTQNLAVGAFAGMDLTTGTDNTLLGYSAGKVLTGTANTLIGSLAATVATSIGSTTGVGYGVLSNLSTGSGNSCFGRAAGYGITTATNCVALGYEALGSSAAKTVTGTTGVGYRALYALTTGAANCATGHSAGLAITSGDYNSLYGSSAGLAISTGAGCCLFGCRAGDNITTAEHAIVIGFDVDARSATAANQINIGGCFERLPTTEAVSTAATAKSYANNSTTDIVTLSSTRGYIEFHDSADGWARVRFNTTSFSMESSSADWVASGSPTSAQVGLVVTSGVLQMKLGSAAARSIGWQLRLVKF